MTVQPRNAGGFNSPCCSMQSSKMLHSLLDAIDRPGIDRVSKGKVCGSKVLHNKDGVVVTFLGPQFARYIEMGHLRGQLVVKVNLAIVQLEDEGELGQHRRVESTLDADANWLGLVSF